MLASEGTVNETGDSPPAIGVLKPLSPTSSRRLDSVSACQNVALTPAIRRYGPSDGLIELLP